MPYINRARRNALDTGDFPDTPGELNYEITQICLDYLRQHSPANYDVLNDIVGVLECAKLEFYRRTVSHYEDKKIMENGDVYPAKSG